MSVTDGPVHGPIFSIREWASLRPIWQRPRVSLPPSYKKRGNPPFCRSEKLKRSSAENPRRPKTLAVELSLFLSCAVSLSSLSLLRAAAFSLSPCRRRVVVVVTGSQPSLILVSRSRSRLRWSILNPSCSHVLYTPLCWS